MAETPTCTSSTVHQLHSQQSDLTNVKALLRRDTHWTSYLADLFEQWACGNLQTTRVFTDQWPDCTCVVMCYQFQSPDDSKEIAHCFVGRESANAVTILQQPGVINWNITNRLRKAFEKSIADNILEMVYNPLGREFGQVTKFVTLTRYQLLKPAASSQRDLPDGFYFQELHSSLAEYIGEYWGFWRDVPKLQNEKFRNCISVGGVGIFTDSTTPHKLVSWAVRSEDCGEIHHLYTLEEYRGRGLASAVVREMSRRIQDKGKVPFCYIVVGNSASVALFKELGFVQEEEKLYCYLQTDSK